MASAEDRRMELGRKPVRAEVGSVVGEVVVAAEEIGVEIEVETEAAIGVETELESDALDLFHEHLSHCRKLKKHGVRAGGKTRWLKIEMYEGQERHRVLLAGGNIA